MAGLRVIETENQEVLNPRDLMAIDAQQKAQEQKRQQAKQAQRLKDIEAVDNDLKVPYFRNQISKLTKEYQDYVQSDEYDPMQASRMKEVILNAKRNLGELDAHVAKAITKDSGIYQERFNELFNGTIDYDPTPESLAEAKEMADYANIEQKDIIEVYNTDLKGVADGLLKAKETELGKSFNVSGKNFREVIQRLDPEDIDELARVAASRPELQKYYESQLGRQITAQELKDLAYNDLFKFTPLERKTRESGFKKETDDDDIGWRNGRYSNKRYRLSQIDLVEEAQGGKAKKYIKGYDATRIVGGDPDLAQFFDKNGKSIEGRPNSVVKEGDIEFINLLSEDITGRERIVKVPLTDMNKTRLFNYLDIDESIHQQFIGGRGKRQDVGGKSSAKDDNEPSGAPKVGERRQGADGSMFEYMGGNPADKSNWKKIK